MKISRKNNLYGKSLIFVAIYLFQKFYKMISRRIIRTKVLQILYAYYSSEEKSIPQTEKEFFFSINKTYDLYHYLMLLLLDVADYAEKVIEIKQNKHFPTPEELNPNKKFVNNGIIKLLRINVPLQNFLKKEKLSWVNHPDLIRELYLFLTESETYDGFMNSGISSFSEDKQFADEIFSKVFLVYEDLHQVLEEQSIYWNDDIDFVMTMISKTIRRFEENKGGNQSLLPAFKDEDDRNFAKELLRKSIINQNELRDIIHENSQNWDIERIAFVDILIMQLALAEFLYFPTIPTKVTMNEYIELSKFYSTEKSRNFINGILDKALKDLRKEDKIKKIGRGLIGETV
jgi:transcription antitermination protein NusB